MLNGFKKDLLNKNILVTAGPTYEDIDPVRFIGNRSSGKMGFQIAKAALFKRCKCYINFRPYLLKFPYPEINLIKIRSANEMKSAVDKGN